MPPDKAKHREACRKWEQKNKAKRAAYKRALRAKDREKYNSKVKAWRERTKDRRREVGRLWWAANKERLNAKRRAKVAAARAKGIKPTPRRKVPRWITRLWKTDRKRYRLELARRWRKRHRLYLRYIAQDWYERRGRQRYQEKRKAMKQTCSRCGGELPAAHDERTIADE